MPLKSSYASAMPQQTAVFMYSTAGPDGQTVTLQLRETDETIELPASMLSKMSRQTDTATLSISYQDSAEVLTDGTIDLLLATTPLHSSGKPPFVGHDILLLFLQFLFYIILCVPIFQSLILRMIYDITNFKPSTFKV